MKEHIVNNVYALRRKKNVTQDELAKLLHISRQTIVAIEKGNYIPSLLLGIKIARFFNKKVEEIFLYTYEK